MLASLRRPTDATSPSIPRSSLWSPASHSKSAGIGSIPFPLSMSYSHGLPYGRQRPGEEGNEGLADVWPPAPSPSSSSFPRQLLPSRTLHDPPRSRSDDTEASEASSAHTWGSAVHPHDLVAEGGYLPGATTSALAAPRPQRPFLEVHQRAPSSERSASPGAGNIPEASSSTSVTNTDQQVESSRSSSRRRKRSLSEASIERRKAQNRTAQKAFRERKERYVRDLEERTAMQTEEIRLLRLEVQRLQALLPSQAPGGNPFARQPPQAASRHTTATGYWANPSPGTAVAGREASGYSSSSPVVQQQYFGYAAAAPPPTGPDYTSVHPAARTLDRSTMAMQLDHQHQLGGNGSPSTAAAELHEYERPATVASYYAPQQPSTSRMTSGSSTQHEQLRHPHHGAGHRSQPSR